MKYVKIMWDSGSEVEKCIDGSLSSVTSKDRNDFFWPLNSPAVLKGCPAGRCGQLFVSLGASVQSSNDSCELIEGNSFIACLKTEAIGSVSLI